MKAKPSREKKLYLRYTEKVSSLLQDEEAKVIFDSLAKGKNTYMRVDRVESSAFDLTWIKMIENCIPDLSYIVANPRMNTKTVTDLVPVELAKKTNAESVQHLASHTQYIKEVDEDLNVIPSKILNIGSDDELKTYENKFIATLIKMLVLFIEKRYEYASRFSVLHDHETLYFKNHSQVGNAEVNIETRINVVTEKDDPESIQSNKYVDRIAEMRRYILYFYNSKFMKLFKNEKNVRNPILQTNIIRKNVRYHNCYELYRFLEAYDRLGINYAVKEAYSQFDNSEIRDLNYLMFANYLALQGKDKSLNHVTKENHYEPEILTSSDDEEFEYGPLYGGPISFVRVDSQYQKYLAHRLHTDLPPEPSEGEKAYFADEYQENRDFKRDYLENLKLFKRKADEKIVFDKRVQEIIAEREKEEKEAEERYIQKRLRLEARYLDIFRQKISDDARGFLASVNNNGIIYPDYQGAGEYSENLAQQELPFSDEELCLLTEHKDEEKKVDGQVDFNYDDKPSQVFSLQKELADKNQEIALLNERIKELQKKLGLIEEDPIDKRIRLSDMLTDGLDEVNLPSQIQQVEVPTPVPGTVLEESSKSTSPAPIVASKEATKPEEQKPVDESLEALAPVDENKEAASSASSKATESSEATLSETSTAKEETTEALSKVEGATPSESTSSAPIDAPIVAPIAVPMPVDGEAENATPIVAAPAASSDGEALPTAIPATASSETTPVVIRQEHIETEEEKSMRMHDELTDDLDDEFAEKVRAVVVPVMVPASSKPASSGKEGRTYNFNGMKLLTKKLDLHAGYAKNRKFKKLTRDIDLDKESQYHERHLKRTLTDFCDEVDYMASHNIDKAGEKGFIVKTRLGYLSTSDTFAHSLKDALIFEARADANKAAVEYRGDVIEL